MLVNGNDEIRDVTSITDSEKEDILNFLQGSVYSWCKNRPCEWFSLRDLMGGENYYWEGTPLYKLYEYYETDGNDNPVKAAGKDAGWLLKEVIVNDERNFKTKKEERIRKYKWI